MADLRYDVGDTATVEATWKVNDAATDPGTVTLRVLKPSGATDTYVYGVDAEVGKSAVGSYNGTFLVDEPGVWAYRFEGTDPAPGVAAGEINVDPSPFYPDPLNRALCTVADVKEYVGAVDDEKDGIYARLINAASQAIHKEARREFKAVAPNPATRVFDIDPSGYRHGHWQPLEIDIGDLSTPTAVETTDMYGAVHTYDLSGLVFLPRNRDDWEPYTRIRFPTAGYTAPYVPFWGGTLSVTGTWGFPKVPEDIRQACVVTVATWDARDVANYSATFNLDQNRVELPHVLPRQVQETVDAYKRRPPLLQSVTLTRSY